MLADMKQLVLSVLVLGGCNKSADPNDCGHVIPAAIDRMMQTAKADMPAEAFARVQQVAPKIKEAITRVCRDDKWPADVIDCHRTADTQADINICQRKLTATQRAHTDQATAEVIDAYNKETGRTPAGSASGSAEQH
jgi:hypothetical protein